MESLLYNPCSTVVTERPLDQGETMEMSVEPQSENCQSQVKIFLTHTTPSTLKLQNPRTYFNERKVLDRLESLFFLSLSPVVGMVADRTQQLLLPD